MERISQPPNTPAVEEVVVWDADGLRVVREHACFRDLAWSCGFATLESEVLVERLTAGPWSDVSRAPRVIELRHHAGHRMVILPASGRVQLRVCYMIAQADRCACAAQLAAELAAAVKDG